MMMGWYGGGAGWAMMIGNAIFGLLLIAVIVWAVLRFVAATPRPDAGGHLGTPGDARDILDRRFAAGEIDVEAYRAAVRELSTGRSG